MARIAVVGAGAIGGFVAAALARSGADVTVVARGAHAEAIRTRGLLVESDLGSFTSIVHVTEDLNDLGDFDFLLLTFKAHQWPGFGDRLEGWARSGATLVTMQNGLPFWYVRMPPLRTVDPGGSIGRAFPDERVIGAVVHVSGMLLEPGRVRQSGGLRYVFGEPNGGTSERVEGLVRLFTSAGLGGEEDSNIRQTVWLKLVNNVGLNAVSVLEGMTIRTMLADTAARARVRELMEEALRVGMALGAVGSVDLDARLTYAARLDDVKTSMLQDRERGRSLEVEPILGAVCELAGRYGIATPAIRAAFAALTSA